MLYNVIKLNIGGKKMIVNELSEGLRKIFIKWEQTFRGQLTYMSLLLNRN